MFKQMLNPDIYHGFNKKGPFFEGWYFKITTADGLSFAFIPGVFILLDINESYSFIQVFDGTTSTINFVKYPFKAFTASRKSFDVFVLENYFSNEEIILDIKDSSVKCSGKILIKSKQKWPDNIINPGSMGFYNYLTFMECYTQVCALSGKIEGSITLNEQVYDLDGGKIYIEKNWGKSFPSSYIWCQCNYFQEQSLSVTCSIGHIPMPYGSFIGFIIGLYYQNKLIKFTSINRSELSIDFADNSIIITAKNSSYTLMYKSSYNTAEFAMLYAPSGTSMLPTARETLTGTAKLILKDNRTDSIILENYGIGAGVEFAGDYLSLQKSLKK